MKNKGFTLVELLAVIVILAIILAIAVPIISSLIENSKKNSLENSGKLIFNALKLKQLEEDLFNPTTIDENTISSLLNIDNNNIKKLSVCQMNGETNIILAGKNQWEGYTLSGTASNLVLNEGIVLYLDPANCDGYPGTGTTIYDLSGNDNNGSMTNGLTISDDGMKSMLFDGSDDYLNVGNGSTLKLPYNVTISAWIKIGADASEVAYRSITGQVTPNRNYNFYVRGNGVGQWSLHLSHQINNTSTIRGSLTGSTLSNNTWYQVVGIISLANNGSQIYYLNGSKIYEATNLGFTTINTFDSERWIGKADNFFKGNIGIIQIHSRALSSEEILQNYNATKGRYGL